MKKIVLTGGGTAGHVTANIALMPHLKEAGYEISYIGSYDGIEKRLIPDFDIPITELPPVNSEDILIPRISRIHSELSKALQKQRKYLKKLSLMYCSQRVDLYRFP